MSQYASALTFSGALQPNLFEQPGKNEFFNRL
jgi:hypothetical protein